MLLDKIPPGRNPPKDVNVLIEIPMGGPPVKYEMDKDSGALIVYNADSEAEVEQLIHGDPFCRARVFERWAVRPWKIVMANSGLMP